MNGYVDQIFTALPALLVFVGLIALSFYWFNRKQSSTNAAFRQVADELGFDYSENPSEIARKVRSMEPFHIFQKAGTQTVEAMAYGEENGAQISILNLTARVRGSSQTFSDAYIAIWIVDHELYLPALYLQPKEMWFIAKLRAFLASNEPEIALSHYPKLSNNYTLQGRSERRIQDRLAGGVGNYLDWLAGRSTDWFLNAENQQFLLYLRQASQPNSDEIIRFYTHSLRLHELLLR